jgi:hypothetical protein
MHLRSGWPGANASSSRGWTASQRRPAGKAGTTAEFLFDTEHLVPFAVCSPRTIEPTLSGDAAQPTARWTNAGVLPLAGTGRDDHAQTGRVRGGECVRGAADRARLIDLEEQRVGGVAEVPDTGEVGRDEVVTSYLTDLNSIADRCLIARIPATSCSPSGSSTDATA